MVGFEPTFEVISRTCYECTRYQRASLHPNFVTLQGFEPRF